MSAPLRRHPYRLIAALAAASLCGLVGMMLGAGAWDALAYVVALAPVSVGAAAYVRSQRGRHPSSRGS